LEVYLGFWKEDKQSGLGRHIWVEDIPTIESYNPESVSNKAFMKREFVNRYEGMFREGKRNGLGIFFYSNGSIYEGEWVNDNKQGFCIFTDVHGNTEQHVFIEDKSYHRIDKPKENLAFSTVHTANATLETKYSEGTERLKSNPFNVKPSGKINS
jgi:hypothetical protein